LENSAAAFQRLEDEFAALRPALEDLAR
jgi:hypothetical protein